MAEESQTSTMNSTTNSNGTSSTSDLDSNCPKRAKLNDNGEAAGSSKSKVVDLTEPVLLMKDELKNKDTIQKLKNCWNNRTSFTDDKGLFILSSDPFLHAELHNFIQSDEDLDKFVQNAFSEEVVFQEKASDLFQFKQSYDLKSVTFPGLYGLREFFKTTVLNFLRELTDLPLNGKVDMFLSEYNQTDHLLCHDDELESRRIAFILYFSKDWKAEYGGSLDLFGSNEAIQPTSIVKSINPEFNKFVFFDVTCKSFHQVSEVTEPGVKRLALSGWFLGEPLPRPCLLETPCLGSLLGDRICKAERCKLSNYLHDTYKDTSNYATMNAQLEENSEVMLVNFLQEDVFSDLSNDLDSLDWKVTGPVNFLSCYTTNKKFWPEQSELTDNSTIEKLIEMFHSMEFLGFLQEITEFPFTKLYHNIQVSTQLNKYEKGCYKLLKANASLENEYSDSDSEGAEEEEAAQFVDVIYFGGVFNWEDSFGGEVVYNDEDGEQLITISPRSNSLAIIVRTKSVNSYVNYINSLAKAQKYFSYSMTFSFL